MDSPDTTITEEPTFNHYRVLRHEDGSLWKLGSGGMGTTYKAIDNNLEALVALKVISANLLDQDPSARDRFIREAKTAASLRHTNAATVYHLGIDSQSYFYAMEFIAGETVEQRVKRLGPLPVGAALALVLQAARALGAAHRLGLVHRDIKPANLMLMPEHEDDGEGDLLKLIDFGLAKSLSESGPGHEVSQQSVPFYTPAYASPEQCEELPADIRSDIYSLGITLWFMLTGVPTFRARSTFELQSKHLNAAPPLADLDAADVPACVRDLLLQMLAKDPADRFQSPSYLRRAIEACQRTLISPAPGPDAPLPPVPPYSFSLDDLLRRRGNLDWDDVRALLPPLVVIADDLAAGGAEALANFVPRRVHAVFPSFQPPGPEAGESRPATGFEHPAAWQANWPDFTLLALTAAETTFPAADPMHTGPSSAPRWLQDAPQALAALLYELLGGKPPVGPPDVAATKPLTVLNEAGNALLRRALLGGDPGFGGSAQGLRAALEAAADASSPRGAAPVLQVQEGQTPRPSPPQRQNPPAVTAALKDKYLLVQGLALAVILAALVAAGAALFTRFSAHRGNPAGTTAPLNQTPGTQETKALLVPENYPSIQAAIDAAHPGDTVRVRAGEYTEAIEFKAGICLVGEGMDRTVVRCPVSKISVLTVRDVTSGWISDLGFEPSSPEDAAHTDFFGVSLNHSNVQLCRCRIRLTRWGIGCVRGDRSLVQDCEVCEIAGAGIAVSGSGTTPILAGNRIHNNSSTGILYSSRASGVAAGNFIENGGTFGVDANGGGTNPKLIGNTIRGNKATGIMIWPAASAQIEGNIIEEDKDDGIGIMGNATITGNQVRWSRGHGISLWSGTRSQVKGNIFELNERSGINVEGTGTSPSLLGNTCLNNGEYGIAIIEGATPNVAGDNVLTANKWGRSSNAP